MNESAERTHKGAVATQEIHMRVSKVASRTSSNPAPGFNLTCSCGIAVFALLLAAIIPSPIAKGVIVAVAVVLIHALLNSK
jgi:hypothetical protein